ncbi:MAG TPA: hypothetical protein EYG98_02850 [Sulfurovum sp.]|nr:hypothetical protein [Sulfurovum sp.]
MEEIIARFEIVRLAVKLADNETIDVQILKLRDLSIDEHLNEIISLLEDKNYRQALYMMKGYVASLDDSFFKESPVPKPKKKHKETQQETQNLFDMTQPRADRTINLDDMLKMTEDSIEDTVEYEEKKLVTEEYLAEVKDKVKSREDASVKAPLIVESKQNFPTIESAEETMPEPIVDKVIKVTQESIVEEFNEPNEEIVKDVNLEEVLVDNVDTEAIDESLAAKQELEVEEPLEDNTEYDIKEETYEETFQSEDVISDEIYEEKETLTEENSILDSVKSIDEKVSSDYEKTREKFQKREETDEVTLEEEKIDDIPIEEEIVKKVNIEKEKRYPAISYIDQKFRNMRHQYPQMEESENGIIEEVKVLLKQVATNGYTELDIKNAISEFKKYKQANQKAEAAQILLLAAASESKYAQLLLARELFTGDVLQKDYPESFTQINRLAEHDYPEAICDLAQLYEHGYGIKKDKKTAILLYEEAADMGITRAEKHLERLSHKKGIFSSLFK